MVGGVRRVLTAHVVIIVIIDFLSLTDLGAQAVSQMWLRKSSCVGTTACQCSYVAASLRDGSLRVHLALSVPHEILCHLRDRRETKPLV